MSDKPDPDKDFASVEILPPEDRRLSVPTSDIVEYRKKLIESYHGGARSLLERLAKSGKSDLDSVITELLQEIIQETDNLLGNGLVATNNGDLRDASVIAFKRAEVLEKAMKVAQTKQQIEKQGGVDVDSPVMMVIFRFFLAKTKEAFISMGVDVEMHDLFFRKFGEVTENWRKELKKDIDALKG